MVDTPSTAYAHYEIGTYFMFWVPAGITAMTALVEVNTSYAGDEKLQEVIIKCLDEDDDRTIGKKVRR